MEWINEEILSLIRRIEAEQIEHLKNNVADQMIDGIIETSTFNNSYIDATRHIKNILRRVCGEITETIKHHIEK